MNVMYCGSDVIINKYRIIKDARSIYILKKELKNQAEYLKKFKSEIKNKQKNGTNASNEQSKLFLERFVFRHKFIAYCLERGTEYDKIENPQKNNKPNWAFIDRLRGEYSNGA